MHSPSRRTKTACLVAARPSGIPSTRPESALGAILCFLLHNAPLVTLDVARRISSMLGNALAFSASFISHPLEEPSVPPSDSKRPSLRTRESSLRRRVYQCFTGTSSLPDSVQSTLLQSTILVFAGPEGDEQAAIVSSSGPFTTVWQAADRLGYGVSMILCRYA
jgi:hypothetical protein